MKIVDTAGRVERFERRYGARRRGQSEDADQAGARSTRRGTAERKATDR